MAQSNRPASNGMRASWHYTSTIDAMRKMYRHEGVRSFYSGLTPALLGLTHVAVQFPLYEFFKMKFTGYGLGDHPPDDGGSHWMGITAATFFSKIIASTVTYPHEVLRTRMQTQQRSAPGQSVDGVAHRGGDFGSSARVYGSSDGMVTKPKYRGSWKTCQVILAEEGWRAFYAGIGTNLVRAVPAAMTTMLTYEWLSKLIRQAQEAGVEKLKPHNVHPSPS